MPSVVARVLSSVAPGGSSTETTMREVSSSGRKPVGSSVVA